MFFDSTDRWTANPAGVFNRFSRRDELHESQAPSPSWSGTRVNPSLRRFQNRSLASAMSRAIWAFNSSSEANFFLVPQLGGESDFHFLSVKIAGKIEQVNFDNAGVGVGFSTVGRWPIFSTARKVFPPHAGMRGVKRHWAEATKPVVSRFAVGKPSRWPSLSP